MLRKESTMLLLSLESKGEGGGALLRKESTTLLLSLLEPTENFLEGREERGLESPEGMEAFLDVSEEGIMESL